MNEIQRAAVTGLFALWLAPLSAAAAPQAATPRPEPALQAAGEPPAPRAAQQGKGCG